MISKELFRLKFRSFDFIWLTKLEVLVYDTFYLGKVHVEIILIHISIWPFIISGCIFHWPTHIKLVLEEEFGYKELFFDFILIVWDVFDNFLEEDWNRMNKYPIFKVV